jgi:CRISPR-associated protein Cas1
MDPDTDQLYGRVRNRILTLSGNNPSIRVAKGLLVIRDGPTAWVGPGEAPPVEQRMTTLRIARGERTVNHVIALRPTGFYTGSALQFMHDVGIAFTLLSYNGRVVFSTGPAGTDQPALRRAQALASTNSVGFAIMRAILHRKLHGQAEVARTMLPDGQAAAAAIDRFADAIERAQSIEQVLAGEAAGAATYWMRLSTLPIRFARRDRVPDGWQQFGPRHSTLTDSPHHAVSPANAIVNFLYTVAEGQLSIALVGAGIDPGIAVFHQDQDRRRSMALDALEALRPFVDAYALRWLTEARFAKRDFSERPDGSVRITRPLSSHLAMTSIIWRRAAEIVAGWLREALTTAHVRKLPPPLPHFPAPRRSWSGTIPPVPRTCAECGSVLPRTRRRLCSTECAVNWHLNVAQAETGKTPIEVASSDTLTRTKIRRHRAERFLWDVAHGGGDRRAQLRLYYKETIEPKLATLTLSTTVLANKLGVTERYIQKIRGGVIPHARHFQKLAELAGVKDDEKPE